MTTSPCARANSSRPSTASRAARSGPGIDAEAYWSEGAGRPLDGSLPDACVAEIETVTSKLRERLANDASVYVKVSAPSVKAVVNGGRWSASSATPLLSVRTARTSSARIANGDAGFGVESLAIALDVECVDVEVTRATRAMRRRRRRGTP